MDLKSHVTKDDLLPDSAADVRTAEGGGHQAQEFELQEATTPTTPPDQNLHHSFFHQHALQPPTKFSIIRDRIRLKHHRARYVSPGEDVKGRKNLCKAIIYEIFATREMAPKGYRELYVKYSIRQLCIFSYFLLCLTVVAYSTTSKHAYYYKKSMMDIFIDEHVDSSNAGSKAANDMASVEDLWLYLENGLPNNLYWENYYTSAADKNFNMRPVENPVKGGVLYVNELMGVPRLRQIRVKSDSCPVADDFRHLNRKCYPPYAVDLIDTGNDTHYWEITEVPGDRGPHVPDRVHEAWHYRTESELAGTWHWGEFNTYIGSGAVVNLAKTKRETIAIVQELKRHLWIEKGTRAVFLDFTLYNYNVDLFCVIGILWEFPATGGITQTLSIRPLRLLHYQDWYERYVVGSSEVVVSFLSLYYFIQEMVELHWLGLRDYLRNIWSCLDLLVVFIVWVAHASRIYLSVLTSRTFEELGTDKFKNQFQNFEYISYWRIFESEFVCIGTIFSWFKLFKYIAFNKTMALLAGTLHRCSQDIAGFSVMFFIAFIAFAQLGYLQFGAQVKDFSTIEDSIFTLFQLILGGFDFKGLEAGSPVLGPIFFVAYVFFIFFVLLNMFLAIMNDTYSEVKAEIQAQRNEFELADYIHRAYNNFRSLFGSRSTALDAENAVQLAAADGQLTFDEIRRNLRRTDFADLDIEIFLARYELTEAHGILDEEGAQQILDALQEKHHQEDIEVDSTDDTKEGNSSSLLGGSSESGLINYTSVFKAMFVAAEEEKPIEERIEQMHLSVVALESSFSKLILQIGETTATL